jgi:hypothetical protein
VLQVDGIAIREIIDQVIRGQIRIPAFQRGFVWEPERVAYLMDSIYKRYPFGSLLFWRTKEKLKVERDLGPFELPDPKADYPVDYVLDGQQRVTSIFAVFQNELKMKSPNNWLDIYFDIEASTGAQDTQFVALSPAEADPKRFFPMNSLFDTVAYRAATKGLDDSVAKRIDEMQSVFKEMRIPVQFSSTEDRATVAIIFERVNRQGVELDTLQLLSAWTWSEEFALQEQFADLALELEPFGFKDVGEDTTLLLRCCSAVLANDSSPESLISLNGERVRSSFEEIMNGVRYSVDYFRRNFLAEKLSNLPFSTMLIPLTVFFSAPGNKERKYTDDERKQINRWFWRAAFSRRYSSGVIRNLNTDIVEMGKLKRGEKSSLGEFAYNADEAFFLENSFGMGSVNSKTFILLLAQEKPLSFVSGAPIDLAKTLKDANRNEFHHMMPRDFLKQSGQNEIYDSVLANMCFLSRADNRNLGGEAPSKYRSKLPKDSKEILGRALASEELLLKDDYKSFVQDRASRLSAKAKALCS